MRIRITRTIVYEGADWWIRQVMQKSFLSENKRKFHCAGGKILLTEEKREEVIENGEENKDRNRKQNIR